MNFAGHLFRKYAVDQPLSRELAQAFKARGHDGGPEMTAPGTGTLVAGMKVAFVHDLDVRGLEVRGEFRFDSTSSVHGVR